MSWIIEKLIEIIVQAVVLGIGILGFIVNNFLGLNGKETLNVFFNTFPPVANVYKVFIWVAFAILYLNLIYQLFKCYFGPILKAESPTHLVIRTIIFSFLITFSQTICAIIIEICTIPYKAIQDAAFGGNLGTALLTMLTHFLGDNGGGFELSFFGVASAALNNIASLVLNGNFIITFIMLIFYIQIIKEFIGLILEVVERYIVLALLVVVAPLCIACGASQSTSQIFSSWLQMLIGACIVMIFSVTFISVFLASFTAVNSNPITAMIYIAWLKTGKRIDEHMNNLGLKVAKTGGFGDQLLRDLGHNAGLANGAINSLAGTGFGQKGAASNPITAALSGKSGFDKNKTLGSAQNGMPMNRAAAGKTGAGAKNAATNGGIGQKLKNTTAAKNAAEAKNAIGNAINSAKTAAATAKENGGNALTAGIKGAMGGLLAGPIGENGKPIYDRGEGLGIARSPINGNKALHSGADMGDLVKALNGEQGYSFSGKEIGEDVMSMMGTELPEGAEVINGAIDRNGMRATIRNADGSTSQLMIADANKNPEVLNAQNGKEITDDTGNQWIASASSNGPNADENLRALLGETTTDNALENLGGEVGNPENALELSSDGQNYSANQAEENLATDADGNAVAALQATDADGNAVTLAGTEGVMATTEDGNNVLLATDADGNLIQDADGNYQTVSGDTISADQIDADSIDLSNTGIEATEGVLAQTTDGDMVALATDTDGNLVQDADGNYQTTTGDTISADQIDANNIDLNNKGFATADGGVISSNDLAAEAQLNDGSSVALASTDEGVMAQLNDGSSVALATDADGNLVQDANGNFQTTDGKSVSSDDVAGTMAQMNDGSTVALATNSDGNLVQDADGNFQTTDGKSVSSDDVAETNQKGFAVAGGGTIASNDISDKAIPSATTNDGQQISLSSTATGTMAQMNDGSTVALATNSDGSLAKDASGNFQTTDGKSVAANSVAGTMAQMNDGSMVALKSDSNGQPIQDASGNFQTTDGKSVAAGDVQSTNQQGYSVAPSTTAQLNNGSTVALAANSDGSLVKDASGNFQTTDGKSVAANSVAGTMAQMNDGSTVALATNTSGQPIQDASGNFQTTDGKSVAASDVKSTMNPSSAISTNEVSSVNTKSISGHGQQSMTEGYATNGGQGFVSKDATNFSTSASLGGGREVQIQTTSTGRPVTTSSGDYMGVDGTVIPKEHVQSFGSTATASFASIATTSTGQVKSCDALGNFCENGNYAKTSDGGAVIPKSSIAGYDSKTNTISGSTVSYQGSSSLGDASNYAVRDANTGQMETLHSTQRFGKVGDSIVPMEGGNIVQVKDSNNANGFRYAAVDTAPGSTSIPIHTQKPASFDAMVNGKPASEFGSRAMSQTSLSDIDLHSNSPVCIAGRDSRMNEVASHGIVQVGNENKFNRHVKSGNDYIPEYIPSKSGNGMDINPEFTKAVNDYKAANNSEEPSYRVPIIDKAASSNTHTNYSYANIPKDNRLYQTNTSSPMIVNGVPLNSQGQLDISPTDRSTDVELGKFEITKSDGTRLTVSSVGAGGVQNIENDAQGVFIQGKNGKQFFVQNTTPMETILNRVPNDDQSRANFCRKELGIEVNAQKGVSFECNTNTYGDGNAIINIGKGENKQQLLFMKEIPTDPAIASKCTPRYSTREKNGKIENVLVGYTLPIKRGKNGAIVTDSKQTGEQASAVKLKRHVKGTTKKRLFATNNKNK